MINGPATSNDKLKLKFTPFWQTEKIEPQKKNCFIKEQQSGGFRSMRKKGAKVF